MQPLLESHLKNKAYQVEALSVRKHGDVSGDGVHRDVRVLQREHVTGIADPRDDGNQ